MKTRGLSCEDQKYLLFTFLWGSLFVSPGVSVPASSWGKPPEPACISTPGGQEWTLSIWHPALAGKATSSGPPGMPRVLTHVHASSSMHPLECTHLVSLSTILPSNTSGPLLTCMPSSFLDLSIQQVPTNVTWNAPVPSWFTVFSCGYRLLNTNWII